MTDTPKYKYVKLDAGKWAEIDQLRGLIAHQRGSRVYIPDVIYEAIKVYKEMIQSEQEQSK